MRIGITFPTAKPATSKEARLSRVLLDQHSDLEGAPLQLPMPMDPEGGEWLKRYEQIPADANHSFLSHGG